MNLFKLGLITKSKTSHFGIVIYIYPRPNNYYENVVGGCAKASGAEGGVLRPGALRRTVGGEGRLLQP